MQIHRLPKSLYSSTTHRGFSVVELTVVILFGMLVAAFSLHSFGKARASYDLTLKAQTLAGKIERARWLAIRLNKTLTLSMTEQSLGLTCSGCGDAKAELPNYPLPDDITLSAYPTLTISANGVIQSSAPVISLRDGKGKQIDLTVKNSGRVTIGEVVSY
jgi:Tfp pilus assembly protein FimT